MEKIKRVIGVDPGLTITGFGILDYKGGQIRTVAFGTIKPPVKESLPNRLEYLNSHMTELLEKFEPNAFAIEDTFFSQNVKSALLLGQARGVLLLAAASKGIPSMDYAPRKIKQSVVGNGAADKTQVQYMVQQILKMDEPPKPLDVSDALAIGLCHIYNILRCKGIVRNNDDNMLNYVVEFGGTQTKISDNTVIAIEIHHVSCFEPLIKQ